MLTICLLILIGYYLKKPVGALLEKIKGVDWKEKFSALWRNIEPYAKKAGRFATKPILLFYFVVTDGVVLPFSFIPRIVYRFLGVMDEAAAVLFVYSKVKDKITPAIETKVETILDAWFGAEFEVIA